MVFHTTSSNTGHVSAACISLQQVLGRALLWSGCRNHIGELILSHVFEDLRIEASKSPQTSIFKRLRTNYNMINLMPKSPIKTYHIETINEEGQLLAEKLCAETLPQCSMDYDVVHDDYGELTELTILYCISHTKKAVSIKRPGALHKAPWMAKLLYVIKLCLLDQISAMPAGTITTRQQITCALVVEMPKSDRCFVQ